MLTYWRSPFYNTVRFAFTIALGLIIGAIYWDLGNRRCENLGRPPVTFARVHIFSGAYYIHMLERVL